MRSSIKNLRIHDSLTTFYFISPFAQPLFADLVKNALEVNRLGALNRQTQRPVPDELCKWSKTTADTKGGRVVKCLGEAVVVEKNARRGVDVGVGVLGLHLMSVKIDLMVANINTPFHAQ
jgi:hypothetical protein